MSNRVRGYVRNPTTGAGVAGVTVTLKNHVGGGTVASTTTDANGLYEFSVANVLYPGEVYEEFTVSGQTKVRSGRFWGQLGGMVWVDTLTNVIESLGIGVQPGLANGLAVTAPGGVMSVNVATGSAILKDGVPYILEATTPIAISAADPTNPRIDRIILRLTREGQSNQGRILLQVLAGSPNASPTPPSLTQSSATWDLSLVQVRVDAGVTSIATDKTTDERSYAFGWPSGITAYDGLYIDATGKLARLANSLTSRWSFVLGDGVNTIAANSDVSRLDFQCPFNVDVLGWKVWSPTATASIVIDILKGAAPTSYATVAGSEKPTLSAAGSNVAASDTALTTWTDTTWDTDEHIRLDPTSVTNTKRAYLTLQVRKR